ncbi:flagellar FlbD family protein [Terriglobus tenax]|uniref:flagellar FlbD family protein n=1 Tax=Terriglobus tenax TaxID=1111115 RepID=UPI0021DF42B8|nr:flagellar FlbD family protein [Terriglobus tenax]
MIELTRLNGHTIYMNAELIKYIEAAPDTMITLVTGEKIVVREGCQQVMDLALHYKMNLLRSTWPTALEALTAKIAHGTEPHTR